MGPVAVKVEEPGRVKHDHSTGSDQRTNQNRVDKIQNSVFTIDEQFKKISAQLEAIDKSIAALDMNLSDFNAKAPKEDTAARRIELALHSGAFDKLSKFIKDGKKNK